MKVFLDFEASSLGKKGVPIEVARVFEDGRCADYLIRPAPDWDDWDPRAEAIHRIDRPALLRDGWPHDLMAAAMVDQVALSFTPSNQRSNAAVNNAPAPASINRVSEDRSFTASILPKTPSAVSPIRSYRAATHSRSRAPRMGWARYARASPSDRIA